MQSGSRGVRDAIKKLQGGVNVNLINLFPFEIYQPSPNYQFGFDVKDDEFTNYQNRKESREGNIIKGSYSVVDSDGFMWV